MMMVDLTSEAKNDLFDAVDYYEDKEQGLGKRLRDEVASMLNTVASAPYLWRERAVGYRRVNCPVFPYLCSIRDSRWCHHCHCDRFKSPKARLLARSNGYKISPISCVRAIKR